jgi:hypothetical protein
MNLVGNWWVLTGPPIQPAPGFRGCWPYGDGIDWDEGKAA